jgi:hypothetical protein
VGNSSALTPTLSPLRRERELHPERGANRRSHSAPSRSREGSTIGAVEGVLSRVLLEKPGWLELGLLKDQLTRLVLSYLSPITASASRSPSAPA